MSWKPQITAAVLALAAAAPVAAPVAAMAQLSSGEEIAAQAELGETAPTSDVYDPWEGFNRRVFKLNNAVDKAVFVPTARFYRAVTHKKERKGVRNFLANLRTPAILVNDLLQGEFKRASQTAGRFVINSTIGFGGMGDPAERMGIPQHSEDFGQTLAVWGVSTGPYLYLPFFGPSTIRDGFGAGVGLAMDPAIWLHTPPARYYRYTRTGVAAISLREPLIEPLEDIEANSLDYYASIRSFYMQARKREILNGRTNYEDLPDIGDFDEFDEVQ